MRGERRNTGSLKYSGCGSSPHTRGTHKTRYRPGWGPRFIPACAGNATKTKEKNLSPPGSSPHARGTHRGGDDPIRPVRFIPAYAGNAASRCSMRARISVHPRMRGERSKKPRTFWRHFGSSPHTRGTPRPSLCSPSDRRFIPAYAGNARDRSARHHRQAVHPRIRGERALTIGGAILAAGSSPHTRGTPRCFLGLPCRCGSSPHTRGTPAHTLAQLAVFRFIPAYAGNAGCRRRPRIGGSVHPRIRGERDGQQLAQWLHGGSSPHTRGTRRNG